LTGDPRFVDPATWDYHILPGSAAFDTALDVGVNTDVDNEPRPMGHAPDIGADELRVSLAVDKVDDPHTVEPGEDLLYTIYVTNTGKLTLTADIDDILPVQVTTSDQTSWSSVSIVPEDVWVETISVTVNFGVSGIITNEVQVTTAEGATGVCFETTLVTDTPDITVNPLALGVTLNPNLTTTQTLEIGNVGEANLHWSIVEMLPASWLSESPDAGTVVPMDSTDVAIIYDAPLTEDTYTTTLRILSDDPDESPFDIPVILTVTTECIPVNGVSFDFVPAVPVVGAPVAFTGHAVEGTPPVTYTWDFGTGDTDEGASVFYTYAVSDTYTVVMTATNCQGTGVVVYQEDIAVISAPDITVSPLSFDVTLRPDETDVRTLTIGNAGSDATLNWNIAETPAVGWLDESPTGGAVAPLANTPVNVTFDATGLTEGTVVSTTLQITSNDPDESPFDVPVTLTVGPADWDIYLPVVFKLD
jgi:uncharacterized repeat protein (TIGR01451 family)